MSQVPFERPGDAGHPRGDAPVPGWVVAVLVVAALVAQMVTLGLVVAGTSASGRHQLARFLAGGPGDLRPGAGPGDDAASEERRRQGVQHLVDALNAAVHDRDRETFLAQVDLADPALRERWARQFRAATSLPLRVVYEFNQKDLVPTTRHPDRPGALIAAIDVVHSWVDWDPVPLTDLIALTVAPVEGRWLIVADDDSRGGVEHGRAFFPWAAADVVAVRSRNALVIVDETRRVDGLRLAGQLEAVLKSVRSVWSEESIWDGKVIAYALSAPEFLSAHLDSTQSQLFSLISVDGSALRVVVTPNGLVQDDEDLQASLRYDVTMIATTAAGAWAPMWMQTGAAQYMAMRRTKGGRPDVRGMLAASSFADQTLAAAEQGTWVPQFVLDSDTWPTATDDSIARTDDAFLACLFLADRYGEQTLRALYEVAALGEGSPAENQDEALRSVLHLTRQQFEAQVTAYGRRVLSAAMS